MTILLDLPLMLYNHAMVNNSSISDSRTHWSTSSPELCLANGRGKNRMEAVNDAPCSRGKELAGAAPLPRVSIHRIRWVTAVEGG